MKTIEINLYSFNELSKEAQQKALQQWNDSENYLWGDEAIASLEKFAQHFGATLAHYEIDWFESYRSKVRFDLPDSPLTVKELKTLILSMGTYNAKTLRGTGECKFTGFCMDEEAADGARKAYFNGERDLLNLLNAGYENWHKAATADFEQQQSIENFAEICQANEYTFEADGTMNNS